MTARCADAAAVIRSRRFERGAGCSVACSGFLGHDPSAHAGYGIFLALRLGTSWPSPAVPRIVRTGPLVVDRRMYSAFVDGQRVSLSPRESDLLVYLAARIGELCRHDDILRGAWGPEYVLGQRRRRHRKGTTNADWDVLRATMSRLKAKLGGAMGLISNVTGRGYCLEQRPVVEDA
jgi:DNA-binding response OmpR family regulator